MLVSKQVVDTPRKGAWYTRVNQSGFIPPQPKPQRVVIGTMTAQEYKEQGHIFNGHGNLLELAKKDIDKLKGDASSVSVSFSQDRIDIN